MRAYDKISIGIFVQIKLKIDVLYRFVIQNILKQQQKYFDSKAAK